MSPPRTTLALTVALGLGVSSSSPAQSNPSDANISTGSGAGTSAGVNPGQSPSGTRTFSGNAPGTTPLQDGPGGPGRAALPSDITGTNPSPMNGDVIANLTQEELDAIDARILDNVRKIARPEDRSLAMERVARAKLYANQQAGGAPARRGPHRPCSRAGQAALDWSTDPVTPRHLASPTSSAPASNLADELTREGMTTSSEAAGKRPAKGNWTLRRRMGWFDSDLPRRERSATTSPSLPRKIENSTLRSEIAASAWSITARPRQPGAWPSRRCCPTPRGAT